MPALKKRIAPATVAALLLLTVPACNSSKENPQQASFSQEQGAPKDVIQKVNGTAITRSDLNRAVMALLEQKRISQPATQEAMQQASRTALEQLVSAELLYQAAGQMEIKDLDRQVAQKLAQTRATKKNEQEFQKTLKEMGLTLQNLQELIRKDVVISNFVEKNVVPRATVTEAEAKRFYDANKDQFQLGEMVRASHILIGITENAGAQEKEKAREKAQVVLKRVKEGENFGVLAGAYSDCPSKVRGGDLGPFGKGKMDPAFEKAAFALKPGKISDVVETRFGYHIIKVAEKKGSRAESFEMTKERIQAYLQKEKTLKLVSDLVAELRSKARIEKI